MFRIKFDGKLQSTKMTWLRLKNGLTQVKKLCNSNNQQISIWTKQKSVEKPLSYLLHTLQRSLRAASATRTMNRRAWLGRAWRHAQQFHFLMTQHLVTSNLSFVFTTVEVVYVNLVCWSALITSRTWIRSFAPSHHWKTVFEEPFVENRFGKSFLEKVLDICLEK